MNAFKAPLIRPARQPSPRVENPPTDSLSRRSTLGQTGDLFKIRPPTPNPAVPAPPSVVISPTRRGTNARFGSCPKRTHTLDSRLGSVRPCQGSGPSRVLRRSGHYVAFRRQSHRHDRLHPEHRLRSLPVHPFRPRPRTRSPRCRRFGRGRGCHLRGTSRGPILVNFARQREPAQRSRLSQVLSDPRGVILAAVTDRGRRPWFSDGPCCAG